MGQCYNRASWTINFLSTYPLPTVLRTPPFPSLLVIALSWTYLLTPRLEQDALRTVRSFLYLLHALPLLLLYYLRVHQYLLMCTICAPFVPV